MLCSFSREKLNVLGCIKKHFFQTKFGKISKYNSQVSKPFSWTINIWVQGPLWESDRSYKSFHTKMYM